MSNDGKTQGGGPDRAEVMVAFAAVGLGLSVWAGSMSINLGSGYDRIGPRFFPMVVAAGLVLSGSVLAWGALRRRPTDTFAESPSPTSWPALGWLASSLALSVLLLDRAGFVLTSTLTFWLVARAFESRRPLRDVVVGAVLSVFVYAAFTRGLGLALPAGFLGGLF